jgi:molecular chaperone GrpE
MTQQQTDPNDLSSKTGSDIPADEIGAESMTDAAPAQEEAGAPEEEIAMLRDQFLRAHAEMQNLRKRTEREKQEAAKYGISLFARDILTVADNLRRALDAVPRDALANAPEEWKNLVTGVEVTERELLSLLARHGVNSLNPLGQKFDPHFHQAIVEVDDCEAAEGTVVQVIQTGFLIGDRLLRPAMVGVAKRTNKGSAG